MKLVKNSFWFRLYRVTDGGSFFGTSDWDMPENLCTFMRRIFLRGFGILLMCLLLLALGCGVLFFALGSLGLTLAYYFFNYPVNWTGDIITCGLVFWGCAALLGLRHLTLSYVRERRLAAEKLAYSVMRGEVVAKPDNIVIEWLKGVKGKFCPTLEIIE